MMGWSDGDTNVAYGDVTMHMSTGGTIVACVVGLGLSVAGASVAGAQVATASRAPSNDLTAGWKLRFTPDQIQQLVRVGFRFDAIARRLASRYAARGFTAEQFVLAYLAVRRHDHLKRKDMVDWTAFVTAGLPEKDWKRFRASGRSLTDFYNRDIVGGLGMCIGGWVVLGLISMPALLTGFSLAVAFAIGNAAGGEALAGVFGGLFGGIFLLSAAVGLPLVIVGTKKIKRWVKNELLDKGTADELRIFRIKRMHRSSLDRFQLRIVPVISRRRQGVAVSLTF